MKKLLLIISLMSGIGMQAYEIDKKLSHPHHVHDDIDDLLHEAFNDGVHHEIMKPKELRWYEQWMRSIGGALFIKYLMLQSYVRKIVAFEK